MDTYSVHSASSPAVPNPREVVNQATGHLVAMGFIKPAQTPWASQIVFVRKKDGLIPFFVNYLELNAVEIQYFCSILSMDECIN